MINHVLYCTAVKARARRNIQPIVNSLRHPKHEHWNIANNVQQPNHVKGQMINTL